MYLLPQYYKNPHGVSITQYYLVFLITRESEDRWVHFFLVLSAATTEREYITMFVNCYLVDTR